MKKHFKKTLAQYVNEVRRMRPYVAGFESKDGYDLRKFHTWKPAQKALITRYAKIFAQLTAGSFYVYRPRLKSHLHAALKDRNVQKYKRFKVAFIPSPKRFDPTTNTYKSVKPKITFKKDGSIKIRSKSYGVTIENFTFDHFGISQEQFVNDPEAAINALLGASDYEYFSITAGEHEVGRGQTAMHSIMQLEKELNRLINKYGTTNYDPDDKSSSHYGNWLFGLRGYRFEEITELLAYTRSQGDNNRSRDKYREAIKKERAKISRQQKALKKLARNKYINEYVHRQAQQNITQALKTAKDKGPLLELRKYLKASKGEKLPDFIRLFMEETINAKIDVFNNNISEIIRQRLHFNQSHQK